MTVEVRSGNQQEGKSTYNSTVKVSLCTVYMQVSVHGGNHDSIIKILCAFN